MISLFFTTKAANTAGVQRADKRYISLAVAYGIRARINLTMQNWTAAAADANDAITEATAESIAPASIADVSKPGFKDVVEKNWMWGIIIFVLCFYIFFLKNVLYNIHFVVYVLSKICIFVAIEKNRRDLLVISLVYSVLTV